VFVGSFASTTISIISLYGRSKLCQIYSTRYLSVTHVKKQLSTVVKSDLISGRQRLLATLFGPHLSLIYISADNTSFVLHTSIGHPCMTQSSSFFSAHKLLEKVLNRKGVCNFTWSYPLCNIRSKVSRQDRADRYGSIDFTDKHFVFSNVTGKSA